MGTPGQQIARALRARPFTRRRNKTFQFHTNLSTAVCATIRLQCVRLSGSRGTLRPKKVYREDAMKRWMVMAAGFATLIGALPAARAAEFPTKPITLVLGFAPGGPSDV